MFVWMGVDALRVSVYGIYSMLRGYAIMSRGKRLGVQLKYLTYSLPGLMCDDSTLPFG